MEINVLIILTLPLFAALLMALLPEGLTRVGSWLASLLIFAGAVMSISLALIYNFEAAHHTQVTWFSITELSDFTIGLLLDTPALFMLVVVNVIAFFVFVYSTVYMKGDTGYKRYFTFLSLFTFSMLGIVVADNLLMIFVFWELVGVCSYLLIGHWYERVAAGKAAMKAFIVNRIGDVGFLVGLSILWAQFGTLDLQLLRQLMTSSLLLDGQWVAEAGSLSAPWLSVAGIALFMGAMGKSAQFPLQVWLPDAMEGPTPVSALIHAATMVAAGVFLMIRVFVLLDLTTLTVIAYTGAITAFMAAVAALTQYDIKKVLAYSTISQLGYMLMGVGTGSYDAAFFHLFTHAFFKSCLFLAAGAVIFALHRYAEQTNKHFDAQDMRNMGGLWKHLPFTFFAYLVASLALIGIPFFSGFLSKDALLSGTYGWAQLMAQDGDFIHYLVPALGFITVALTAIYMVRQLLLVFFGENTKPVTESPVLMRVILIVLAVMSFGIFWSINPFSHSDSWFLAAMTIPDIAVPGFGVTWQPAITANAAAAHLSVAFLSFGFILIGVAIAWYLYKPGKPIPITHNAWQRLSYHNWYLDELYQKGVVSPLMKIATLMTLIEKRVINYAVDTFGVFNVILAHVMAWIDKAFVDGFVRISVFFVGRIGHMTRSIQGGRVQTYIVLALFGLLLMLYWII